MTILAPSTIFALSTPLGRSGLCIFRISGPKAIEVKINLLEWNANIAVLLFRYLVAYVTSI